MKTRMESDRARAQVYKALSVIAVIIIAILSAVQFKLGQEK